MRHLPWRIKGTEDERGSPGDNGDATVPPKEQPTAGASPGAVAIRPPTRQDVVPSNTSGVSPPSSSLAAAISGASARSSGASRPKVPAKRRTKDGLKPPVQVASPTSRAIPAGPSASTAKIPSPISESTAAPRANIPVEVHGQQGYHHYQQQRRDVRREGQVGTDGRRARETGVQQPSPQASPLSPPPGTPRAGTRHAGGASNRPGYSGRRSELGGRRSGVAHGVSNQGRRGHAGVAPREKNGGGPGTSPPEWRDVGAPARERKGSAHAVGPRKNEKKVNRVGWIRKPIRVKPSTRLTSGGVSYVSSV